MFATLFQSITQTPSPAQTLKPKKAQELILSGRAPAGLSVKGHLDLQECRSLVTLPDYLHADSINVSGCRNLAALPAGLRARRIDASGCRSLRTVNPGVRCYELNLSGAPITRLPADLQVDFRLNLTGCSMLESLPDGLKTGCLMLNDCVALESLPEDLAVSFLDISGCVSMHRWPRRGSVQAGRLTARGCVDLISLPDWMTDIAQLDLSGCVNLTELPPQLRVHSWLDIAGTGIASLPGGFEYVQLHWRGVAIDRRIAFQPETITAQEVLSTPNVELRRVLMERMGYDRFMEQSKAKELDSDKDAGGKRRLLKVKIEGDEPLVCLAVRCPSTGREYMLRVPPTMRTCRKAAAWLAGFDDPDAYRPIQET
jgi:hypothetical protein